MTTMITKLPLTLTLLAAGMAAAAAEKKQDSNFDKIATAAAAAARLHLLLNGGRPGYVSTEYWTAYINVSYPDGGDGGEEPTRSDRTEVGRFASGNEAEVTGVAVEMISTNGSRTGCYPQIVANYPTDQPWIAVVSRGSCTFNVKIRNAVAANASGMLVYDNVKNGPLQSMMLSDSPIPSVFTYAWKGAEITKMIRKKSPVTMTLKKASRCRTARHMPPGASSKVIKVLYCIPPDEWAEIHQFWNFNATGVMKFGDFGLYSVDKQASVLFVTVSFLVLVLLSMAWLVFFYVQRYRYHHEKDLYERRLCNQAKRALALMSTSVLKNEDIDDGSDSDSPDTCAVCIETYKVDEVVRILPCKHQFHKCCIDQWLLDKRTCPMCKMDILKHYGLEDETSEDAAAAVAAANAVDFV